jgi:DNA polymerase elongation subunit (family B)
MMEAIKEKINNVYVKDFVTEIGNGKVKENYLEVEFEKTFEKMLTIKKRRYLGKLYNGDWVYKGVDLKRSNTPEIIKKCLQNYLDKLFEGKNENEIILECRNILKENKENLELYQIPFKLSKEYASDLPQKRAATWANRYLRMNYQQGSKFYGIWTEGIYDVVGFSDIEQLKNIPIKLDMKKYESILADKLNNLKEDDVKFEDLSQTKLF